MKTAITYVLFLLTYYVSGQFCATTSPPEPPSDFHEYLNRSVNTRSGKIDTVIIYPIVGLNRNLTPAIEIEALENGISETNEVFKNIDLHFRLCSNPLMIQDDDVWNLDIDNSSKIHDKYGQSSVINLYIPKYFYVKTSSGIESPICGVATFPSDHLETRMVIINGDCLPESYVLAHELGHYYGLYHTHESSLGRELVRRVNCEDAGDLMCDTSADPKLSEINVDDCVYTGKETDREGKNYFPPVSNIMSYAPFDCKLGFSQEQLVRMRYVHEVYYSSYTSDCGLPDYKIRSPLSEALLVDNQELAIQFSIENLGYVNNAPVELEIYLTNKADTKKAILKSIELNAALKKSQNFKENISIINAIHEENPLLVIEIDPENKVRELNKSNNRFEVPLNFDSRIKLPAQIYPNPFIDNFQISLNDVIQTGDITLHYYDTKGKMVKQSKIRKDYLNFYYLEDLSALPSGMYLLSISINKNYLGMTKIIKLSF